MADLSPLQDLFPSHVSPTPVFSSQILSLSVNNAQHDFGIGLQHNALALLAQVHWIISSQCWMYLSILKYIAFYELFASAKVNGSISQFNEHGWWNFCKYISENKSELVGYLWAISCQFTRDLTDLTYPTYPTYLKLIWAYYYLLGHILTYFCR